jgi:hypothetical protein
MATVFIQKRKCKSCNSYSIRYKDPVMYRTTHFETTDRYTHITGFHKAQQYDKLLICYVQG